MRNRNRTLSLVLVKSLCLGQEAMVRAGEHLNRLSREVSECPSLKTFKTQLPTVLGNPRQCALSGPAWGGWLNSPEVPSTLISLQFFDSFYPIIITDVKPGKTFFLERQTLWGKQSGMVNCIMWVCFCKSRGGLWWHICYGRERSIRDGGFTWSAPLLPPFPNSFILRRNIMPVKMRKQTKTKH